MSLEKIQQALITQFQTGFPTWQVDAVAWENKAFTPPTARPWMAFFFLPVDERIATLGPTGRDEANGMIQIDVNYPIGIGEAGSRITINELRTCFRPGVLHYSGQAVTILSRSRATGRQSDGFFKIPFTVRWRSQLTR